MIDKTIKVWPSQLEPKTVVPGLYVNEEGSLVLKFQTKQQDVIFININGQEVNPVFVYQTTVVGERECR